MKKSNVLLLAGWLLLGGCSPRTYTRIPANGAYNFFSYQPDQTIRRGPTKRSPARISAHRGGGDLKGYPENCIESFAFLAKNIPVIIECDIDLTRDSVMVMMHDATLDRTTTGTGKLIDRTHAETRQYKLEDNMGNVTNYQIPTLEEVLRWGKNRVTFTLDVKRNVSFAKVVDMIHKTGAGDYAAVITYNAPDAALVHRLDSNLMISVTIRNRAEYDRLHDLGIPNNRMVAFVGVREPERELYQFLHEKKIACILGTLGNLDKQAAAKGDQTYRTFAENGADIMSTDRPLELWRAVN